MERYGTRVPVVLLDEVEALLRKRDGGSSCDERSKKRVGEDL